MIAVGFHAPEILRRKYQLYLDSLRWWFFVVFGGSIWLSAATVALFVSPWKPNLRRLFLTWIPSRMASRNSIPQLSTSCTRLYNFLGAVENLLRIPTVTWWCSFGLWRSTVLVSTWRHFVLSGRGFFLSWCDDGSFLWWSIVSSLLFVMGCVLGVLIRSLPSIRSGKWKFIFLN